MTAQTFATEEKAIRKRDASLIDDARCFYDRRLCLAEIDRLRAILGRDDGKQLVIERLERERDDLAAENRRQHEIIDRMLGYRLKDKAREAAMEAALRKIMKFSVDLDPDDNARQCGHYIESVARVALQPTQTALVQQPETPARHCKHDDGDCHADDPCVDCPKYSSPELPAVQS